MNMNRIVLTPLCQRVPYTLIMLEDILAKNVTENANTVSQKALQEESNSGLHTKGRTYRMIPPGNLVF